MIWLERNRIPAGNWPFLNTVRNGLSEIEAARENEIDLTEGQGAITITGCLRAYRHAVFHRVLELAQSTIILWNAGFPVGAIVASRSLLETIAIYHSLLRQAQEYADGGEWTEIGNVLDSYAFSRSDSGKRNRKTRRAFPSVGTAVREFIKSTQPGQETFWDQICDTAHPNGERMMRQAGTLTGQEYVARDSRESEGDQFIAVYNSLYSCCWLIASDLDLNVLLEHIRTGEALPSDHPLIEDRALIDRAANKVADGIGSVRTGPHPRTDDS